MCLKVGVNYNRICFLPSHLYKVICRLDCHIQKTKEGNFRCACEKTKQIFPNITQTYNTGHVVDIIKTAEKWTRK